MRISNYATYRSTIIGPLVALMVVIPLIILADVYVDTSVTTDRYSEIIFTSDTDGYLFYTDASNSCAMATTTDSGVTWSAARSILASCLHISAWYDQDTPGDSGNLIHVATLNATDMYYTQLNTATGALSSAVDISSPSSQGGGFAAQQNFTTIAKATDGYLYAAVADNSDSFVVRCNTTCTTGANWSEAGTNPMDLTTIDSHELIPLTAGDMMLIRNDVSAEDFQSKIWDVSAGSWAGSWTNIDTTAIDDTSYPPQWNATLNTNNHDVYIAYTHTASGAHDLRAARYNGASWSTVTLWDDKSTAFIGAAVSYDPVNDRAIIGYLDAQSGNFVRAIFTGPTLTPSYGTTTLSRAVSGGASTNDHRNLNLTRVGQHIVAATWSDGTLSDQVFSLIDNVQDLGSQALTRLTGNVRIVSNLTVTGALAKSSGTFVIDHPLEPRDKLLYHSFVESPDVKNIYDGVARLDENGEARIELPAYFQALNTDYRYQFFPHGEAMPDLHVKEEVRQNSFVIAGGSPGGEISWQVSGNRHDPYILANPVVTEVVKTGTTEIRRGECVYEPLCE